MENRRSFTGVGLLKMYEDYAQAYKSTLTHLDDDEKNSVIEKGEEYLKRANEKTEG